MNSTSLEWNMAGGGGIGTASYSTSLYTQPYSHNISQEQVPNVQQDQYEPEQLYGVQHPIRLEANQFDSYSDYKAYLLLLITHYQQQLKSIQSFPNQTNYTYEMEKNVTQEILRLAFNYTSQEITPKDIVVIIMYSLVILVSLFGNLSVCKVLLFKQKMRRRMTNVFIANLTTSDLLMTVSSIPMTTARLILDNWPFGVFMCKLSPFVQSFSVFVSSLSMTMIAIDRYQVLVRPLRNRVTNRVPRIFLIAMIWFLAALLSIPAGLFTHVKSVAIFLDGETLSRCQMKYPTNDELFWRRLMTVYYSLTQFFIPLVIASFCYVLIGVKISKRSCIGETTEQQEQCQINAKRKTIKMLVIVVAVFAICWLPYNLYFIIEDFFGVNFTLRTYYIIHWLAMSSICYNPFIYFWLNTEYRQGIIKMLTCFRFLFRQRQYRTNVVHLSRNQAASSSQSTISVTQIPSQTQLNNLATNEINNNFDCKRNLKDTNVNNCVNNLHSQSTYSIDNTTVTTATATMTTTMIKPIDNNSINQIELNKLSNEIQLEIVYIALNKNDANVNKQSAWNSFLQFHHHHHYHHYHHLKPKLFDNLGTKPKRYWNKKKKVYSTSDVGTMLELSQIEIETNK